MYGICTITSGIKTALSQGQQAVSRLTSLAQAALLRSVPDSIKLDWNALGDLIEGLNPDPGSVLQRVRTQLSAAGNSNELYVLKHPDYTIQLRVAKADTGRIEFGGGKFELAGVGIFHDGPHNRVHRQLVEEVCRLAEDLDLKVGVKLGHQLGNIKAIDLLKSWTP